MKKKQYLCRWKAYTGGFPSCRHNFKVELWFLPNNAVTVFLVLQIQIHKQFYEYHLLDANYLANLIIIVVIILGRLLRDVKVSAN